MIIEITTALFLNVCTIQELQPNRLAYNSCEVITTSQERHLVRKTKCTVLAKKINKEIHKCYWSKP